MREAPLLGVRKLIEEALEAEVTEALGRDYYARSEGAARGHRNGWRTGRLKTAEGEFAYAVPQVRGREQPFQSRVRPQLGSRTEALEDLAVEMYARGLSTRDIERGTSKPRSVMTRAAACSRARP